VIDYSDLSQLRYSTCFVDKELNYPVYTLTHDYCMYVCTCACTCILRSVCNGAFAFARVVLLYCGARCGDEVKARLGAQRRMTFPLYDYKSNDLVV
jgi:hypothetical protein